MHETIKKGILTKTLKKSVFWEVTPCCLFNNYKVSEVCAASFFRVEGTIRTLPLHPHNFFLGLLISSKLHPQDGSKIFFWNNGTGLTEHVTVPLRRPLCQLPPQELHTSKKQFLVPKADYN
jgi:hypothetical protein